jgi:selenocysteine lyase/cysteine desulfurase
MFREKFVPHDGIYLLNHSVGRPPVSARAQVLEHFFDPWESGDAEIWPLWIQQIEQFRTGLGRLLNAEAADFCPQTNLSSAVTKIVHSLPRQAGKNTIVCTQQDFPSMGFVLTQAERAGYTVRMIPTDRDTQDTDVWRGYLTEDVACVLVTHVYSNTSQQLPVREITALAREQEILSIVDICQAVGVVPIDLQTWQADFVVGSCVKWLCGGPGAGYLWVDPEVVELCQPIDVGWFSHSDPFEFDISNFRYAEGALRFWGGTPSVLPYVLASAGVELICDIGVGRIRQHNIELTSMVLDALPHKFTMTPREPAKRGGTLVLDLGESQATVEEKLTRAQVRFDSRNTGMRMSPHIYNTVEEMEVVLGCIL